MSDQKSGATLLIAFYIPGASEDMEADAVADELRDIINEARAGNGGPYGPVQVSLPLPIWVTPERMTRWLRGRDTPQSSEETK